MAFVESALGAVARIGPYFAVISLLPSAGLVYTTSVLASARPWTGRPDWHLAWAFATDVTLHGVVVGAFLTALTALVLHPLQFVVVQALEGYWGSSALALWLARRRIRFYLDRFDELLLVQLDAQDPSGEVERDRWQSWQVQEAARALQDLPDSPSQVMPTRLGNVLRRYEQRAGRPYGLDAVTFAPHLGLSGAASDVSYLQDQRTQLDLAVRLTFLMALLAVVVTGLYLRTGWWLLIALVPYGLALLLYRGACVVAGHYGLALEAVLDLNRHAVYRRLSLRQPDSLDQERRQNAQLDLLLANRDDGVQLSTPATPSS